MKYPCFIKVQLWLVRLSRSTEFAWAVNIVTVELIFLVGFLCLAAGGAR